MTKRQHNVYCAKLSDPAERYDEMVVHMKKVAEEKEELSVEERNLLSVAYKNAVGSRRASYRILTSVQQKEKEKGNGDNEEFGSKLQVAKEYRNKVEAELRKLCCEILRLLENGLIESASDAESKIFLFTMKGDYYRYMAEVARDKMQISAYAASANSSYAAGMKVACADLPMAHPTRLQLVLTFSVFSYEFLEDRASACTMARAAFEGAMIELDNVAEEVPHTVAKLITQLLRVILQVDGWGHLAGRRLSHDLQDVLNARANERDKDQFQLNQLSANDDGGSSAFPATLGDIDNDQFQLNQI